MRKNLKTVNRVRITANAPSIADGGEVEKPSSGNRSSIEKPKVEDNNKKPNSKHQARTKVD